MNKSPESISRKYPVGMVVRYYNPGSRGHGNTATVSDYLCRIRTPEKVSHIVLLFGTRQHVVTVNQLSKYYTKEGGDAFG